MLKSGTLISFEINFKGRRRRIFLKLELSFFLKLILRRAAGEKFENWNFYYFKNYFYRSPQTKTFKNGNFIISLISFRARRRRKVKKVKLLLVLKLMLERIAGEIC